MKLSEIKIATTVALMQTVAAKNKKKSLTVTKDIERQCEIVGDHLGKAFLLECITNAENCLDDKNKFDEIMKKFEKVGARFSPIVEEG